MDGKFIGVLQMATAWAASVTKSVGMDYEEAKRPLQDGAKRPLQDGLITDFVLGTLGDQLTAEQLPPRPPSVTAEVQIARPATPTRPRRDSNPLQIDELNEQVRALRVEAAKLVREKEDALVAAREAVTKSTVLEMTTKVLREVIEARDKDLVAFRGLVESLNGQLQQWTRHNLALKPDTRIKTLSIDELERQLDAVVLRQKLDIANEKLDVANDKIRELEGELEAAVQEKRDKRQRLDVANYKIRELEAELKAAAQKTKDK